MIYTIKDHKNKLIEKAYSEGMRELNAFFGIGWKYNLPNICVLKNRKEIDLFQYKSEDWVTGFVRGNTVYVLDEKNVQKESSHKTYSKEEYAMLIKHELCHLFYGILSKRQSNEPRWLAEGVSIFLSGQMKHKKPAGGFSKFIDSYEKNNSGTYSESGMAVKLLVEKFGKKKLLELISRLKEVSTEKAFAQLFKKTYGFDLNYKNFNSLLHKISVEGVLYGDPRELIKKF